jgi:hypothetical protein
MKIYTAAVLIVIFICSCRKENNEALEAQKKTKNETSISNLDIERVYVYDGEESQKITLIFTKKQNQYFYSLKT